MKKIIFIIALILLSKLSYGQKYDKTDFIDIWERVVNEVMEKDFSKLSSTMTLNEDFTYKIRGESLAGGFRYETGTWELINANKIKLSPETDDNNNFLEKTFIYKNGRLKQLIDKEAKDLGFKIEYQRSSD